jgi:imidazolonepropionase
MSILVQRARIVDVEGDEPSRVVDLRVRGELIDEVATRLTPNPDETILDGAERILLPAFVDAHTHALWAGDRLAEFDLRQRGVSYPDILKAGGGILATVRAVRAVSESTLVAALGDRLGKLLREGTATVEVKSGYGLDTEHELKMLRAIRSAASSFPGTVVPTALLGHALDPNEPHFVERVLSETLPAVSAEFPGIVVDVFCEEGAWSLPDARRLLTRAAELGHPLRLHADQFRRLGALDLGIELGARSVDHLEASSAEDLARLAVSSAFAVMLPATAFHLDTPYPNARALLDAGGRLVLASNCNPGSAPTSSLPFVAALAVRKCGVTAREAIRATTSTAAALLGFSDRGRVAVGQRADLVLFEHRDERLLAYELGGNPVVWTITAGVLTSRREEPKRCRGVTPVDA